MLRRAVLVYISSQWEKTATYFDQSKLTSGFLGMRTKYFSPHFFRFLPSLIRIIASSQPKKWREGGLCEGHGITFQKTEI